MTDKGVVLQIDGQNYCLETNYRWFTIGQRERFFKPHIDINDDSIDSKHAAIDLRQQGVRLIDLMSLHGTYVNGEKITPIDHHYIEKNATIKFGNVEGKLIFPSNELNDTSGIIGSSPEISSTASRRILRPVNFTSTPANMTSIDKSGNHRRFSNNNSSIFIPETQAFPVDRVMADESGEIVIPETQDFRRSMPPPPPVIESSSETHSLDFSKYIDEENEIQSQIFFPEQNRDPVLPSSMVIPLITHKPFEISPANVELAADESPEIIEDEPFYCGSGGAKKYVDFGVDPEIDTSKIDRAGSITPDLDENTTTDISDVNQSFQKNESLLNNIDKSIEPSRCPGTAKNSNKKKINIADQMMDIPATQPFFRPAKIINNRLTGEKITKEKHSSPSPSKNSNDDMCDDDLPPTQLFVPAPKTKRTKQSSSNQKQTKTVTSNQSEELSDDFSIESFNTPQWENFEPVWKSGIKKYAIEAEEKALKFRPVPRKLPLLQEDSSGTDDEDPIENISNSHIRSERKALSPLKRTNEKTKTTAENNEGQSSSKTTNNNGSSAIDDSKKGNKDTPEKTDTSSSSSFNQSKKSKKDRPSRTDQKSPRSSKRSTEGETSSLDRSKDDKNNTPAKSDTKSLDRTKEDKNKKSTKTEQKTITSSGQSKEGKKDTQEKTETKSSSSRDRSKEGKKDVQSNTKSLDRSKEDKNNTQAKSDTKSLDRAKDDRKNKTTKTISSLDRPKESTRKTELKSSSSLDHSKEDKKKDTTAKIDPKSSSSSNRSKEEGKRNAQDKTETGSIDRSKEGKKSKPEKTDSSDRSKEIKNNTLLKSTSSSLDRSKEAKINNDLKEDKQNRSEEGKDKTLLGKKRGYDDGNHKTAKRVHSKEHNKNSPVENDEGSFKAPMEVERNIRTRRQTLQSTELSKEAKKSSKRSEVEEASSSAKEVPNNELSLKQLRFDRPSRKDKRTENEDNSEKKNERSDKIEEDRSGKSKRRKLSDSKVKETTNKINKTVPTVSSAPDDVDNNSRAAKRKVAESKYMQLKRGESFPPSIHETIAGRVKRRKSTAARINYCEDKVSVIINEPVDKRRFSCMLVKDQGIKIKLKQLGNNTNNNNGDGEIGNINMKIKERRYTTCASLQSSISVVSKANQTATDAIRNTASVRITTLRSDDSSDDNSLITITSRSSSQISNISTNLTNRYGNKKRTIVFTGFTSAEIKKYNEIKNFGLQVIGDVKLADMLICNKVTRTYKLLFALARGIPIVSSKYLDDVMNEQSSALPCEDYIVKDTAAEHKYKFQLQSTINASAKTQLFEGFTFVVTKSTAPPPEEIKDLIIVSGGKVVKQPSERNYKKGYLFLVTSKLDKSTWAGYEKNSPTIQLADADSIMNSILQHRVVLNDNSLR